MNDDPDSQAIQLIPIDRVTVINPRVRNKRVFAEIVSNIAEIGLKRPITVTRRDDPDGVRYHLVCGQGRLEAYQALGQPENPSDRGGCRHRGLHGNEPRGEFGPSPAPRY